jgi:RNA recognition motif-containing protein
MLIYAGNLPLETTDEELKKLFEPHGTVKSAAIGRDKESGASEGYGIVEMPVKSEARKAADALRGTKIGGNAIRVRVLKPNDDFYAHAMKTSGGSPQGGTKGANVPRGDVPYRGSGAVRRGGQRGS